MQRRCPLEQVTSRKKAWQSVNHTNWRVCMTLCYEGTKRRLGHVNSR
jgi:hypothetical protein